MSKLKYGVGDKIVMEIKRIDRDTYKYCIGFPGYDESIPNYIIDESQLPILQVLSKEGISETRTYTKEELESAIKVLNDYLWNVPIVGNVEMALLKAITIMEEKLKHM